jgi:hypothetical protein
MCSAPGLVAVVLVAAPILARPPFIVASSPIRRLLLYHPQFIVVSCGSRERLPQAVLQSLHIFRCVAGLLLRRRFIVMSSVHFPFHRFGRAAIGRWAASAGGWCPPNERLFLPPIYSCLLSCCWFIFVSERLQREASSDRPTTERLLLLRIRPHLLSCRRFIVVSPVRCCAASLLTIRRSPFQYLETLPAKIVGEKAAQGGEESVGCRVSTHSDPVVMERRIRPVLATTVAAVRWYGPMC